MPRITTFRRTLPVVQTVSGPPTSGSYAARTLAIDQYGVMWVCRVAGSPGAWEPVGAKELASAVKSDAQTIAGQAYTDVVGLSIVVVSRGRPYWVEFSVPQIKQGFAAFYNVSGSLRDATNAVYAGSYVNSPISNATGIPQSRTSIGHMLRVNDPAGMTKTFKLSMATSHASGNVEIEGAGVIFSTLRALEV